MSVGGDILSLSALSFPSPVRSKLKIRKRPNANHIFEGNGRAARWNCN